MDLKPIAQKFIQTFWTPLCIKKILLVDIRNFMLFYILYVPEKLQMKLEQISIFQNAYLHF